MTARAVNDSHDIFALINPFSQFVWLSILLFATVKTVYAAVLSNSMIVEEIRSFRPSFSATFLPITLGTVLLTGLYKNQLLSSLILHRPTYLVNNILDLASLDSRVEIYTPFKTTWDHVLDSAPNDIRIGLAQKKDHVVKGTDDFLGILQKVQVEILIYYTIIHHRTVYSRFYC